MSKIQVIKYKCCGGVFAACVEPHCYTDKEWVRELRKYVNEGCTVDLINRGELVWGECKCEKEKQPELFDNPELPITL